jgi:hypothetical protein
VSDTPPVPDTSDRLTLTVREVEAHVAEDGWDQPVRLFALVETADLLAREPQLADTLGLVAPAAPDHLTPVEQEIPASGPLDELLARIAWPEAVLGCALVHEVVTLPPGVEDAMPTDVKDIAAWASSHPARQEVRMAVGVLRDGSRACALRVRGRPLVTAGADGADGDPPALREPAPLGRDEVLVGPDLAPGLAAALLSTFEE